MFLNHPLSGKNWSRLTAHSINLFFNYWKLTSLTMVLCGPSYSPYSANRQSVRFRSHLRSYSALGLVAVLNTSRPVAFGRMHEELFAAHIQGGSYATNTMISVWKVIGKNMKKNMVRMRHWEGPNWPISSSTRSTSTAIVLFVQDEIYTWSCKEWQSKAPMWIIYMPWIPEAAVWGQVTKGQLDASFAQLQSKLTVVKVLR